MPYIPADRRRDMQMEGDYPQNPGELNYVITEAIRDYLQVKGLTYQTINDILGALDGAGKEFYRRVAVPYEEMKRQLNGDVYSGFTQGSAAPSKQVRYVAAGNHGDGGHPW